MRVIAVCVVVTTVVGGMGTPSAVKALAQENEAGANLFAGAPTAAKVGDGYKISFTLTKPTDVTVRILDKDGNVVRHLISAVVGKEKAVSPLKPNALTQEILWDGKDDSGKKVAQGAFSVELGAGLHAKMDKFLLDGHDAFLNEITAFGGSNKTGHVFTASPGIIARASYIREFDRDGKYVRTVWPPNPNMKKELLDEFYQKMRGGIKDYNGNWVLRELHDNARGAPPVGSLTETSDGLLIGTPSGRGARRVQVFEGFDRHGRLIIEHKQAPWTRGAVWGRGRGPRPKPGDSLSIFSGPEGKYVYVVDRGPTWANTGAFGWVLGCFDAKTLEPVNRFNYAGLKKLDKPVYHLGTPNEPGDDEAHFKNPTAAAVDDKGRIWVGDADRLKVYDREGKFLKRIDAKTPGFEKVVFSNIKLGTNYKRGGIYFAVGGLGRRKERKLYKIDSLENLKIVWQTDLKKIGRLATYACRLDHTHGHIFVDSEAGIVWVAEGAGRLTLLRILDKGATFEKKVISGNLPEKLQRPQWMRADSSGNIYILDMGHRAIVKTDIDGTTFEKIKVAAHNSDGYFCLDRENNIYIVEWPAWRRPFQLRKFDSDGKPMKIGGRDALPFDNAEYDWVEPGGGRRKRYGRLKGVCVADNGDIYVAGALKAGARSWVNVYTKDGKLKEAKIIRMVSPNDIQMGRNGLYAVEAGRPLSPHRRSLARKKKLPYWTLVNELQKYSLDGGVQGGEGHLWSHPGVGYVNTVGCGYECPGAQICVDDDDRVWITEHIVYNVKAVDSAGNLIARIGSYGNADCDGDPNGKNPKPAIPLAWPQAVARHKDFLLISDRFNARIVRCKLEYTQVKIVQVKMQAVQ